MFLKFKNSMFKRERNKKELFLEFLIIICLFIAVAIKLYFLEIENIWRPLLYILIYPIPFLIVVYFLLDIKKTKEEETKTGFYVYVFGFILIIPMFLFLFTQYFIQNINYVVFNNYDTVKGELVNKSTPTFTVAQWMTYEVKLESGEIKRFDYLIPTKRAMIGDSLEFKTANKNNWFRNSTIITIDKIEKK
ncbi:hypothetical protein CSB11_00735 [Candidatus Campbellbacteria bacterium]|nr:MAG: hypothetical protein CSB11_00735 [Candidatus Campbellbacteria bacterium]